MHDQADELRRLVLRSAAPRTRDDGAPHVVVVSGGAHGVGTTTVAANLAVACTRLGRRTVLVDADLHRGDATALCRAAGMDTVLDVMSGRRTIHEILQPGPAGVQVAPGIPGGKSQMDCPPLAQERLLAEIDRLSAHADLIVMDVGNSANAVTGRFWNAADVLLLVTTDDPQAIMDSYAAIKVLLPRGGETALWTIANKVDLATADDVHERIRLACDRFLHISTKAGASIARDHQVIFAGRSRRPFVIDAPDGAATRGIEELAGVMVRELGPLQHSHTVGAA